MKKSLYTFILLFMMVGVADLAAQAQSKLDIGLRYIEQHAEQWGLAESDYADALVSDMYTHHKTGVTYIYLVQAHKGIPVYNAITPIIISPEGKANVVRHGFIQGLKERISGTAPVITPQGAIKATVSHLGIQVNSLPALMRSNTDKNIYEFSKADFSRNEITVKLNYVVDGDEVKLAWALAIDEKRGSDYYNTMIDAVSGDVILKHNYTKSCTFHKDQYSKHVGCSHDKAHKAPMATLAEVNEAMSAASGSYSVYALPAESPIHGDPSTVVQPHFTDSSPHGWHDTDGVEGPEYTTTRGNNTHTFFDRDDNDLPDGDEPDGGASLVFDQVHDVAEQADVNGAASTVNLFYMNNMMHDITERLGFDEQAGNFQQNNFGVGGNGGDAVLAKSSAGSEAATPLLNNADFSTPPDGASGRMRMFLWTNPSGLLSIDEPAELAGFVSDVGDAAGTGGFGAPLPQENGTPVTGKIVLATDGSPAGGTTVCDPIANAEELNGNVAMVDRGLCDFSLKAYNVQEAGAIAVIICNIVGGGGTDGNSSFGMAGGQNAADVTIVPISLGKPDCDRIKAALLSDIDVSITIQQRPPVGPDFLDGSVDNGIIAHEYGHGISNRLIGGPGAAGCLTTQEQAGEGISDYFSLVMTVEEGDKGTDRRGIGNYADAQPVSGGGIRIYPYSTDMSVNPRTYDDIKTATNQDGSVAIYTIGEVWTSMLWEVYWAFVDRYGLDTSWEDDDAGNYKAVRLAIEGMKMGPCNPSFIDARDAILDADSLFYGGENADILWTSFAKRGLGYLADDGSGSDDRTDGTENFDPLPQAIQTMKIQQSNQATVSAGEEIEITVNIQSHIPETQTGVRVTSVVPEGMTYVDGSASMDASHDNGVVTFEVGSLAFDQEMTITYKAVADGGIRSQTLFLDDLESEEFDDYDFGVTEGAELWSNSFDVARSGEISWWAPQTDPDAEVDFWMDIPPIQVVGDSPALRFYHRYDTEIGSDGGFLLVSRDGGEVYEDVKDKFVRGGYTTSIQYATFAIPLLEGYTGTTNEEFVASYLDLSDYKGEEILVRFRYGSDDNTAPATELRGWFVDDLEVMDLIAYESQSCVSSENEGTEVCASPVQIIIESDGIVGTNETEVAGFEMSVSPNPASEYITVGLKSDVKTPVVISLMSMDGRSVATQSAVAKKDGIVRSFNTANLQKGLYLVQIQSERGTSTRKIVIQ